MNSTAKRDLEVDISSRSYRTSAKGKLSPYWRLRCELEVHTKDGRQSTRTRQQTEDRPGSIEVVPGYSVSDHIWDGKEPLHTSMMSD